MRKTRIAIAAVLVAWAQVVQAGVWPGHAQLAEEFKTRTGAALVFEERDLPRGVYHDLMVPLSESRRAQAAVIALKEAGKLPPKYLERVGMRAIGVFESCASKKGDGFRPYDKELKGYRYFGIYNGRDAVAAAYYTDQQLPLTFHHEVFHHVDSLTDRIDQEDRRLTEILAGRNLYPPPAIAAADLAALKKVSSGVVLTDAVSAYAAKNPAEDKAETARHFMSAMADSLVQVCEQPQLAGSQRILHVLEKYRRSLDGKGPDVQWFVNVALARPAANRLEVAAVAESTEASMLAKRLQAYAAGDARLSDKEARGLLADAEKLATTDLAALQSAELAQASAAATAALLRGRIVPSEGDRRFVVMGREDADGVNWALRAEVSTFGYDALRLASIAGGSVANRDLLIRTQLKNLRLVARFYVHIDKNWPVTAGTRRVFERARDQFAAALPADDGGLGDRLRLISVDRLAEEINADGELLAEHNPYIKKVDTEVRDPQVREAIRRVQPACVQLGNGSGVNVSAAGRILTAAHVPGRLNQSLIAKFPDGRKFTAKCTAIHTDLDVAICTIETEERLPFATIASAAPQAGTPVVCIGQPGPRTPKGEPTGYEPFNVSVGKIRGFVGDPLGPQQLGRTKHDAWTYWGHSGSPLFDTSGQIVAMHNSWDSTTAMRHAVTHQAIVKFLKEHKLGAAIEGQ